MTGSPTTKDLEYSIINSGVLDEMDKAVNIYSSL
jgi:hypothetical protein